MLTSTIICQDWPKEFDYVTVLVIFTHRSQQDCEIVHIIFDCALQAKRVGIIIV